MRILQINAVCGISSTGRICTEISNYLNENGHEAYVAYSEGIPYKNGYKIGVSLSIKFHGLFSRIFGMQAYFSKKDTQKLIKYIDDLKPDIVHLHNLHANYVYLKLLLEYLAVKDIPTVVTLHDCWFYTGKCTHYTVDKCYKWQYGCGNCPRLKKDNPSWFLDRTKKMYADKKEWFGKIQKLAVIGVSDWITNEARKSFLSSAKIVTRIYNWIDLDVFKPIDTDILRHRLDLQNKFIILGIASRWSYDKGLDRFIELSRLIQEDMIIILVGNMDKKVSLPNNVIHVKETHNIDELAEFYSMADVFVNLSLEESFGKVTAEALACGTPAIVIDSTANPELVGEGCGYIVEKNDIYDIYSFIMDVKKKGKFYYSNKCIAYAKENFIKCDRIDDYFETYNKLSKTTNRSTI